MTGDSAVQLVFFLLQLCKTTDVPQEAVCCRYGLHSDYRDAECFRGEYIDRGDPVIKDSPWPQHHLRKVRAF